MGREWPLNNRDLDPLLKIFYTMENIRSLQRRSEFHEEQMYRITQILTGMPGGGGMHATFDGILGELEELNGMYGDEIAGYVRELKAAERILNGILDERLKTFVRMFYVDGIGQSEVKRELELTEKRFQDVRKAVETADRMAEVRWPEEA